MNRLNVKLFGWCLPLVCSIVMTESTYAARAEIKATAKATPLYSLPRKGLYGIGVTDSRELLTVINGNVYAATVLPADRNKSPSLRIDNPVKTVTSSFQYVNVDTWSEIPLPKDVRTRDELHTFINETLKKLGYELDGKFPMLLKGRFAKIVFEIPAGLNATEKQTSFDYEAVRDAARAGGLTFGFFSRRRSTNASASSGGFVSESVLHFVSESGKETGVVKDLRIDAKYPITLFLPR